jgi:DNA-damage-inducible protein J
MASDTVVRARIDAEVKEKAAKVLAEMGLSVSDAIRLLLVRVAVEKACRSK